MVGMDELLMGLIDTRESEEFDKFRYECAWRLGSWEQLSTFTKRKKHSSDFMLMDTCSRMDVITRIDEEEIEKLYNYHLFIAMKYIKSGKHQKSLDALNIARSCVIDSLALASLEACQNIYKPLTRLQALKETEVFANAFILAKQSALPYILEQWKNADTVGQESFRSIEPVKAVRLTLMQYCCGNIERGEDGFVSITHPSTTALIDMRLKLGHIAREMEMYSISEKYLRAVRQVPNYSNNINYFAQLELEEAKLFWVKGDKDIAKVIMQNLVTKLDPLTLARDTYPIYAQALTEYGYWAMESHSEGAKIALLKYFGKTVEMLDEYDHNKNSDVYLNAVKALAVFADEQFVLATKYISSSSYEKKRQCASISKEIVSDYQSTSQITTDEKKSLILLSKQAQLDEGELDVIESERTSYLVLALNNYIKMLRYSNDTHLEFIFRLVSLMLEDIGNREAIEKDINTIPTFKFIPVIPQLLPRLVLSKGSSSTLIKNLIEKCAIDHPHHVLPAIFAVAYSLKDQEASKSTDAFITSTQKANAVAAQKMIKRLKKCEKINPHVIQLDKLWEALISLAYLPVDRKKLHATLPSSQPLMKVKNLVHVQIPTVELKVSSSGEYKNITSVWKYLHEYHLVGGINLPKKITCVGSDGMHYLQLLKGKDDLRQDAVMQQVFQLMNSLLIREDEASKRGLLMRTYKVVPLSQRSGIIQWCKNTTSIGNYLCGTRHDNGAHSKYCSSDYPIRECKQMMINALKQTKTVKLQVYLEICDNLQPVFRHYFFSKFSNPGIWYEMRQAYTRSVATSSIIGYVLGLGDRHLQNILLDTETSEVIHIDLGIAFEQGKILNTPETVPFRLTRDIVDGMGISGVEGVFRRSCEVTMRLMRKHRQSILTVLEVLLYDPLHAWTLKPKWKSTEEKPQKSAKSENEDSSSIFSSQSSNINVIPSSGLTKSFPKDKLDSNLDTSGKTSFVMTERGSDEVEKNPVAVRALERLEHKLLGVEDGDPPSSVESQVEKLIQEAQDPENLCVLYPGWQPFL